MDIDLNADVGEGCSTDAELFPLITSANIACGFHAGDPATAFATLTTAKRYGVRVGAHPGFPDRENFGRLDLPRNEQQVFEDCVYQIGALIGLALAVGINVGHVKPHGALYNLACHDHAFARPVIRAAELFQMPLLGLPGSKLEAGCVGKCEFIAEGFADRRYMPDGTLVPRSRGDALIHDPNEAVHQVEWLVSERKVRTICVHGDHPRAVEFVQRLRDALEDAGHHVSAFSAA